MQSREELLNNTSTRTIGQKEDEMGLPNLQREKQPNHDTGWILSNEEWGRVMESFQIRHYKSPNNK